MRPQAQTLFPAGLDAPTPARTVGLPPRGGSTFFRSERKYQRKPAARHYGKKAFIAHFAGGARYVARSMIGQISPAIRRAPNSPFSAIKMGGPFSLRCLSPLCSAAVDAGQTPMAVFGMLRRGLDGFAAQKAARVSKLYWPFARAARPSVERRSVSRQLAGNHTRPASREACRRAAVKPRTTRMSLYAPARHRRAVRGKGRREEDARRVALGQPGLPLAD